MTNLNHSFFNLKHSVLFLHVSYYVVTTFGWLVIFRFIHTSGLASSLTLFNPEIPMQKIQVAFLSIVILSNVLAPEISHQRKEDDLS